MQNNTITAQIKAHNFEIYTVNESTGEQGWDIKFRTVFATDRKEAREILKTSAYFDCVILHNYSIEPSMWNEEIMNKYANGAVWFDTDEPYAG